MTSDSRDCNGRGNARARARGSLETSPSTCRRLAKRTVSCHEQAYKSTGRCLETEPQRRAEGVPIGGLNEMSPATMAELAAKTKQPKVERLIIIPTGNYDHVGATTLRASTLRRKPDCRPGARNEQQTRNFAWKKVVIPFAFVLILINPTYSYKSIELEETPAIASNELTAGNNQTNSTASSSIERIQATTTSESPLELQATSTFAQLLAKITSTFSSALNTQPTVEPTSLTSTTTTTTTTARSGALRETEEDTVEKKQQDQDDDQDESDQDDSSAGGDDNDAESCKGISAHEPAEGKNLTDRERLVNLQTCLQRKIKRRLLGATRSGLELFDRLSLSGGCSASLLTFVSGLSELKSFAFKFLDASAKIPSGVMFGLLSDFGDFDQCLSIRSNPNVEPQAEVEEGAFSGKYCLLSVRLKYHIEMGANESVPEGIVADGIFWDELVRLYWTSNSTKGFQVGVCVPSRCNNDDLEQIYRLLAESYNFEGNLLSCQDSNDLRAQLTPDCIQLAIIYTFASLIGLTLLATLFERYFWMEEHRRQATSNKSAPLALRLLVCFSISRNWQVFMRKQDAGYDLLADDNTNTNKNDNSDDSQLQKQRPPLSSQSSGEATETTISCRESYCDEPLTTSTRSNKRLLLAGSLPSNLESCQQKLKTTDVCMADDATGKAYDEQLMIKIDEPRGGCMQALPANEQPDGHNVLSHLSGLKLLAIVWITVGLSFLYPSANNYQYYRSIMSMNITRDSVWFATANFTLAIDTLLYITGLVFVYKMGGALASLPAATKRPGHQKTEMETETRSLARALVRSLARKVVRFWPTYLAVIGIAIVVPLMSDGPMWPEMVGQRLGASCRRSFWANLLMINNINFSESEICLPSSWFISVSMQLFLVGSLIILTARKLSLTLAMLLLTLLLSSSIGISFVFAYILNLRAPVIRMDESFVMELDENIFRLYTNPINNLGPFLVGMAGGFILLRWSNRRQRKLNNNKPKLTSNMSRVNVLAGELVAALLVGSVAVLVLSSVFHENYSRLASGLYWAFHRVGWAIVTGYLVHQCATGKWRLLYDVLSLSTFIPLSRLIFIAYLVYPIFIHVHSGLVRDGLHVSIYNMMNIYITRLALTFGLALLVHLLVELPSCSIEQICLAPLFRAASPVPISSCKQSSSSSSSSPTTRSSYSASNLVVHHPLLLVATEARKLQAKSSPAQVYHPRANEPT